MNSITKFSKEIKIQACKEYEESGLGFIAIGKKIGANSETIRRWYLRYKEHGQEAFEKSNKGKPYDKELMLTVVDDYLSGSYSLANLSAKHNLAVSVIQRWVNKWYNEIEAKNEALKGDVYTMKSRKTTFEERLEIVTWVIENGLNYKEAAEKYGVTYALVYKWTRAYIDKGQEALEYKKRGPKVKIDESNLSYIEQLELEIKRKDLLLKEKLLEIEVYKKKEQIEKMLRSQK